MHYFRSRILIFAKAPLPGQVKTRLIPYLGEEAAACLYRRLLERTLDGIARAEVCPVECWCAPDAKDPYFRSLGRRYDLELYDQVGQDLGTRMAHAATMSLQVADAVLLIGGDCPQLGAAHVLQALTWLNTGADAVIAPAEDGGYGLLGLRAVERYLFENLPWGSDRVLILTRQRFADRGLRWRELPTLWDVDRVEDLQRLTRVCPEITRGLPLRPVGAG